MWKKRTYKLAATVGTLILLASIVTTAFAWRLQAAYSGHYTTQYSINSGTWYADYDPNYPANVGSYGHYTTFQWNSTEVSWIKSNLDSSVFGHDKPAIVWHAQQKNSQSCAQLDAVNWSSSNLPGARNQVKGDNCDHNWEIRVLADDPSSLVAGQTYSAQVQFNNRSGITGGQFSLSTYWLTAYDAPDGTVNGGGRDDMYKFCFNSPGNYYYPNANFAC